MAVPFCALRFTFASRRRGRPSTMSPSATRSGRANAHCASVDDANMVDHSRARIIEIWHFRSFTFSEEDVPQRNALWSLAKLEQELAL